MQGGGPASRHVFPQLALGVEPAGPQIIPRAHRAVVRAIKGAGPVEDGPAGQPVIEHPELAVGGQGDAPDAPKFSRSSSRTAHGVAVPPVAVEHPNLERLDIDDVYGALVVDGEVLDGAEHVRAVAVEGPDAEVFDHAPAAAVGPEARGGVGDYYGAACEGVDGANPIGAWIVGGGASGDGGDYEDGGLLHTWEIADRFCAAQVTGLSEFILQ